MLMSSRSEGMDCRGLSVLTFSTQYVLLTGHWSSPAGLGGYKQSGERLANPVLGSLERLKDCSRALGDRHGNSFHSVGM